MDYRQAGLPALLRLIDCAVVLHNFLGKLAPWIVIALCIAVYSTSPIRAGINVFAFFAGMVSSYYLYSNFIAGFFRKAMPLSGWHLRQYPLSSHFCVGMQKVQGALTDKRE